MKTWSILAAAGVSMFVMAAPAIAQAPADATTAQASGTTKTAWNDLPERFQVDAGFFRLNAATSLRLAGSVGSGNVVDFEKDVGVAKVANTFWLDTTLRLGRRHQFKLSYLKLTRDGGPKSLTRDFTWDDKVYTAGLSASASLGTELLSAYYRLSIIKRDRVEFGPAIGLGYLTLKAGLKAQGSLIGPGGQVQTVSLDESAKLGVPTGDLGGFVNVWLSKRIVMRGDYLYIKVSPGETVASVNDGRIAVDFYPSRHVGFGAQYRYNSYRYDQGTEKLKLGGTITYQGFQLYASFLF